MRKIKIKSFTIDHNKLQPGVYVSRKDQVEGGMVTTFDLRMTSPNEGAGDEHRRNAYH